MAQHNTSQHKATHYSTRDNNTTQHKLATSGCMEWGVQKKVSGCCAEVWGLNWLELWLGLGLGLGIRLGLGSGWRLGSGLGRVRVKVRVKVKVKVKAKIKVRVRVRVRVRVMIRVGLGLGLPWNSERVSSVRYKRPPFHWWSFKSQYVRRALPANGKEDHKWQQYKTKNERNILAKMKINDNCKDKSPLSTSSLRSAPSCLEVVWCCCFDVDGPNKWKSKSRHGKRRGYKASQVKARRDMARQGETWQGKAIQDNTAQHNTRQERTDKKREKTNYTRQQKTR